MSTHASSTFTPLNIAILTVSDTRTLTEDTSGATLVERLQTAGHHLADRQLVHDNIHEIRAVVSTWLIAETVQVIIITGGTGFSSRDVTPEAIAPLLDKSIDGFGELFRAISYEEIKTSTIQSRALAGLANQRLIFCLPGSTGACRTGWDRLLADQLDSRHRPCNFVPHLFKSAADACLTRS